MKQYFVVPAYTDNVKVVRCVDGKVEDYDIIAYYEEEGFTYALERVGYQKAQYVPAIEDEIAKLKESLALAEKSLAEAKKCPLKISIEEALKFGLIKEQDFVED